MPLAPRRVCRCGAIVQGRRCPRCQRSQDQARGSASARGYDAHWRIVRAAFLKAHPWCSQVGCQEHALDVDHLIPISLGGTDVWTNLRGYCHAHHSRRTALDQSGWGKNP